MLSRLWEGGPSPDNEFTSNFSRRGGRREMNGIESDGPRLMTSLSDRSSGRTYQSGESPTSVAVDQDLLSTSGTANRTPRHARSDSAVEDGRRMLAAFRERRDLRNNSTPGARRCDASPDKAAGNRTFERLDVSSPVVRNGLQAQRVKEDKSCALGPARSPEVALNTSIYGHHLSTRQSPDSVADSGDHDNARVQGTASLSGSAPSADEIGRAPRESNTENAGGAVDALERSSAIEDEIPKQPVPETFGETAGALQAAFLSSVLLSQSAGFEASDGNRSPRSLPLRAEIGWSSSANSSDATLRRVASRDRMIGSTGSAHPNPEGDARELWASLRRLQDQSIGLDDAVEQQLNRALVLCRDLRGFRTGAGAAGGPLSGHGQSFRLEALQSSLHGVDELLSKRSLIAKAAQQKAQVLGGPSSLDAMLENGDSGTNEDPSSWRAVDDTPPKSGEVCQGKTGWLTAAQLEGFAKEMRKRSSIEISALESEKRKLRSKVDMFQRQVELLQRGGAVAAPVSSAGLGAYSVVGSDTASASSRGEYIEDHRIANMLDARLGEARHLQATLEAEVYSLRASLEEKSGLVDALREALRSSAPSANSTALTEDPTSPPTSGVGVQQLTAGGDKPINLEEDNPKLAAVSNSRTEAASQGLAVRGRDLFAPIDGRSRGRYYSRSTRLLGSVGPVASAKVKTPTSEVEHPTSAARRESRSDGESSKVDTPFGHPVPRAGDVAATNVAGATDDAAVAVSDARNGGHVQDGDHGAIGHVSPAPASLAVDFSPSRDGHVVRASEGHDSWASQAGAEGGDDEGVIERAPATTGTTLRHLWHSARRIGSSVRTRGEISDKQVAPKLRDKSSHAVLIL